MTPQPAPPGKGGLLPRFALARPVTVGMSLLVILVLGGIAWSRIPVQLMPSGFDYPYIWVWMPYPGSTPRETERQIVQPVEDVLETLPGVREIDARAAQDHAQFSIELDQDTDMDDAWGGVVDRMERVRPDLPDDFDQYYIYRYNPDDEPVLWAAISIPEGAEDPAWLIETRVQRRLERVPGVARVEFHGADRDRVYVDFDRERVARHGIALYDVMQALRADNFTMPSGEVQHDGRVVLVRSVATLAGEDEIAALPVGRGLVLGDIADVVVAPPLDTSIHRVDGDEAASIDVYKESGANTIDVCRRLQAEIDLMEKDPALRGFEVHRFFDQGDLIQESIDNLRDSALQGGLLAVLILLYFLRRLRVTLLIAVAIPLSLLMTVVIEYFLGESINVLAMMGLMLSVGMTVDNSIVVVEAIYRRRERGEEPLHAALHGTSEVALAIIASTATTVVVFLPLILMSDDAEFGFMMGKLGLPVCYSLGCSLLVALVVVPLAAVRFVTGSPAKQPRLVELATRGYGALLALTLRHRTSAFVVLVVLLASTAIPLKGIKKADQGGGGIIDFVIRMEFASNLTTDEIDQAMRRYETMLEEHRAEWRIRAIRARRWSGNRRGFVMAFLERRRHGDVTKEEITEKLPKLLAGIDNPGVDANVGWRSDGKGDSSSLELRLTGEDSERLAELGEEIARRLKDVPGILGVEAEIAERGAEEVQILVDRDRAARYGISPATLARTVAFGFRGTPLRPLLMGGREVEMQAGFRLEDREDVSRLLDFGIVSPLLGDVALATVADLRLARGFGAIHRENRKTSLQIEVTLADDDVGAAYGRIGKALETLKLPRGYEWTRGRRWEQMGEEDRARRFALLMSICFVFLLMGMLFESFWTPLAVLLSIPFAFVGVYWMLYLTGTTFELMAGIGLVILVGVVVNNAIVLVDRVQQHRRAGLDREAALLLAGRDRFRPIVMTAATTVVGLIPMAVGKSGIVGIPYFPLGRAVIGGLLASTVLTLILVPLFYTYLDDLKALLLSVLRRGLGVGRTAGARRPGAAGDGTEVPQ